MSALVYDLGEDSAARNEEAFCSSFIFSFINRVLSILHGDELIWGYK